MQERREHRTPGRLMHALDQWVSAWDHFEPQGTAGRVWRHFLLPQLGGGGLLCCRLVGRGPDTAAAVVQLLSCV